MNETSSSPSSSSSSSSSPTPSPEAERSEPNDNALLRWRRGRVWTPPTPPDDVKSRMIPPPRRLLALATGVVYIFMGLALLRNIGTSGGGGDDGSLRDSSVSVKSATPHGNPNPGRFGGTTDPARLDWERTKEASRLIEAGNFDWVPVPPDEESAWEGRRSGGGALPPPSGRPASLLPMHCELGQCRQAEWRLFSRRDEPSIEGTAPATNATHGTPADSTAVVGERSGGSNSDVSENLFDRPSISSSLATLSHVLSVIDGAARRRSSAGKRRSSDDDEICTLWFVGDSLSSDTALAALCQLVSTMNYRITRCDSRNLGAFPALFGPDNEFCETANLRHPAMENRLKIASQQCSNGEDGTAYFDLELQINAADDESRNHVQGPDDGNVTICPRVRIKQSSPFATNNIAKNDPDLRCRLQPLEEEHGLMLINWGVHCNDEKSTTCMHMFMDRVLVPTLKMLSPTYGDEYPNHTILAADGDLKVMDGPFTVLWREHEPQHFASPGGVFKGKKKGMTCGPVQTFNNFRNEQAEHYILEHNLLGKGKVEGFVRIFEALKPLWKLHYSDGGDCTHYCFSPWRFEVTWHGIYTALLAPNLGAELK